MAVHGPIKYGGLNTKSNTTAFGTAPVGSWMDVPLGQMTVCKDFNLLYQALIPRPATSIFSNQLGAAASVYAVTPWVDAANWSGGNYIFAVASDSKIYRAQWNWNQTGTVMTDITGAYAVGNAEFIYQFASLNNILVMCGGTNPPAQITANNVNAALLAGSPPTGNVCKTVNNFLFIGRQIGSSTTFSRVSWSNVGDPQTWTAGNFVDVRKNDGDRVVSLGAIGTDLYIFKSNSISRLSTQTLSISGSVTLGPLETIISGLGAFGPNCVDNLPDGRIVFIGTNLHLYIFDGFSLTDISDLPFPQPNVQASFDEVIVPNGNFLAMKVYPSHNQIVIGSASSGTNSRVYAFDYKENFWAQWTQLNPKCFAIVPSFDFSFPGSGYFNINYSLIEGTNTTGKIVQLDNSSVIFGAGNDVDTTTVGPQCIINVPLTGEYYDFIPRTMLLPITDSTQGTTIAGVASGLTVTFGWDGTFSSTSSFNMQNATTYPNVLVIPIPQTKESGTTVRPLSLQIKIVIGNTKVILHPFYLSDEILA